jgi:DNA polymerase-1
MMESYVLDSTGSNHGMDALALKYLGVRTISYEEVAGKGAKQIPFNHVAVEKAGEYAAEDADITLKLHHNLWPRLQQEDKLVEVFKNIEMPLIPVLADIERHGVLIDPEKLKQQGKELQARLNELEKQAYALAGVEFNMNSPKQLQEILFDQLKLPVLQKTPTGQASTADAVLQELALEFELPNIIIEYRSLSKLISTYTSRLVEQINPQTKRIHTSYHQAGTATGRLSSSEPNLQNIPIRTPEGRRIRKAFTAPKGFQLVSADYSQIELRIMAHMSEDPTLLNAFANNVDIHKSTAAEVWEVPLDEVTFEMRRNAKAINFGLIYGMSAFGLTRQLGIDRKAAQEYIDKYFARYPKVKAYMENTRIMAREKGYVETLWGRRLYLPDIHASQIPRQKAAERTAINAPLQGSAADIIKMAMVRIQNWLQKENIPAAMIMQVHDELVFEVEESAIKMVSDSIRSHMSEVVSLKVPLLVSVGTGYDWDKASEH